MPGTLFYSLLMTETNSFSNIPTGYESFEASGIRRGSAVICEGAAIRPELQQIADFAEERGLDLTGGLSASAAPGAPMLHSDYMRLRGELLAELETCKDVVAVVFNLHGAMISTECEDCEGDLLARIRQIVGPDVPVGAVLDPHAHLTPAMVESADLLLFMKEYPHTDGAARMAELLALVARMMDRQAAPVAAVADCRWLGFFPTDHGPMREFTDHLFAVEREPGVLSVSLVHGFPWGDTSETGTKILVYADGDKALAQAMAERLETRFRLAAAKVRHDHVDVAAAIQLARQHTGKPLILADIADNPGGGAPSDSTFILDAMLEAGIENAALGLLYDPAAVAICHQAGEGAVIDLHVGGKISAYSGRPLKLRCVVVAIRKAAVMTVMESARFAMGDTAWIRVGSIDVVLCSHRVQIYAPDGFRHIGIEPAERRIIVVKSSRHFRAFFADIAQKIVDVDTPGAIRFDFASLPYKNLTKARYPRDLALAKDGATLIPVERAHG